MLSYTSKTRITTSLGMNVKVLEKTNSVSPTVTSKYNQPRILCYGHQNVWGLVHTSSQSKLWQILQWTPSGCPLIQFSFDTIFLGVVSDATG